MGQFRPSTVEHPLTGTTRVFADRPNYIPDFPITMNGCNTRAMRTHWRSLGQPVTVGVAFFNDSPERVTRADASKAQTGTSGWTDTGGCEQPVFFTGTSPGNLVDVAYEARIYDAAP